MKKIVAKKWVAFIVKYAFLLSVIFYLISCCTPFINPKYFFGLTFLAIGFPLLLMVMLVWLVFYLFTNKKVCLIIVFIIALGYKNIGSNIGFNCFKKNSKNCQSITLLSWNICDFSDVFSFNKKTVSYKKYIDFIKNTNADIVCLQDVDNIINDTTNGAVQFIKDSLGYPYLYFSIDIDTLAKPNEIEQYGTCIFSKYPIANSSHYNYTGKYFSESLGFANIIINNKPIRIYNTHLRSMYIKLLKEQLITDFKYVVEDTNLVFHSNAFTKIKRYDTSHVSQAQFVKNVMDTTTIPFVFCADLNSVPSSFVYHTLSKNVNDAFLQNGLGWQQTYFSKVPSMRIDVVLMSKNLNAISYHSPRLKLSDHCPIITKINLLNP